MPSHPDYIYSYGTYYGALYPEDNRKYAIEDARARLAQSLKTRVRSERVLRTRDEDQTFRGDTHLTSEGVLQNMEHVASWTDHAGIRGHPGQEWVLVRVPKAR